LTLLAQATTLLLATVVAVPLFRALGLSAILAFIGAGAALGPWGIGAIRDPHSAQEIAELGVVFLLFVIGLELRPARLRVMRHALLRLGLSQLVATTIVLSSLGWLAGLPSSTALVAGLALSLSSTPLVLQLMAERGELTSQQGRSAFAILLLQDIAVMPVIAVLPLLGAADSPGLIATLLSALRGLGVLALLGVGGRYLLRPLLRAVAASGAREALTAASLLVVVGTALIADLADLSRALGAFVAGVLLADSEYRHELEADLEPFKGLLLGLFFMTVGASANLGLLAADPVTVIGIALALLMVKGMILWAIARASGHTHQASRALAVALPQAGEFGFVLFSLAENGGVMESEIADTLVLAVTLSMIASPLLMLAHSRWIEPWLSQPPARPFDEVTADGSRVIIAGFGRFGQIIGRVLRMCGIRFTALDGSADQVELIRRYGNIVYYGDASRLELLESAGASQAEILVVAIGDLEKSLHIVALARRHFPKLKIMARARNRRHAVRLMDLGVHYVIRETMLSSLELAQHTLESLGMSRADALDAVHGFRVHDDHALEKQREFQNDEQKLIQGAQDVARELESLFQGDRPGRL